MAVTELRKPRRRRALMSALTDFFNSIPQKESLQILRKCIAEKTVLVVIQEKETSSVAHIKLQDRLMLNRLSIISEEKINLKDKIGSFSFSLGTRVFFFKTKILEDKGMHYISSDLQIFELKRRRDERFNVPEGWKQQACVFVDLQLKIKVPALVKDISASGIRLIVMAQIPDFKGLQKISFTFQMHKRAAIFATGLIRFYKKNMNHQILGIEFAHITPLFQSKIQNVCVDLERAQTKSLPK